MSEFFDMTKSRRISDDMTTKQIFSVCKQDIENQLRYVLDHKEVKRIKLYKCRDFDIFQRRYEHSESED